jgi:hypothetical protein
VNTYDFVKMRINLDCLPSQALTLDKKQIRHDSVPYPFIWHEYTHYLQHLTTTLGVFVTMNWMAVMSSFVKAHSTGPLLVPLIQNLEDPFNEEYVKFITDLKGLIGCKVGIDDTPPASIPPYEIYGCEDSDETVSLCLEDEDGVRFGVPLIGDVFFEGWSQAVQWLAEGYSTWDDSAFGFVGSNMRDNIYYHALARYFSKRFPETHPCYPIIALSSLCLMTRYPGHYFASIVQFYLKDKSPTTWEDWLAVRSDLMVQEQYNTPVAQGVADARERINVVITQVLSSPSSSLSQYFTAVAKAMHTGLQLQCEQPEIVCVVKPDRLAWNRLSRIMDAPPIVFRQVDPDDPDFKGIMGRTKLAGYCFFSDAARELIDWLHTDGLPQRCSFYDVCSFTKGSHCSTERLNLPVVEGKTCMVGAAADALGIRNRPLATASPPKTPVHTSVEVVVQAVKDLPN